MEVPAGKQVSGEFVTSIHGEFGCRSCHGGQSLPGLTEAHQGLITDPARGVDGVCIGCHPDIARDYRTAVHSGTGMQAVFLASATTDPVGSQLVGAFYEHECAECHAGCGDCHVQSVDGLHTGHEFMARPAVEDSCLGCHLRGAAGEYIGQIDGMTTIPDVHYEQGLDCLDCHSIERIHGVERSELSQGSEKECSDCHPDMLTASSEIEAHRVHPENLLDCRVCHALPVENCYNCHINPNGPADVVTRLQLRIGKNPAPDAALPYEYVVVRHIPIRRDLLAGFAPGLLPGYDEKAEWRITAPHNIRRITPQNKECNSCHGVEERFLTANGQAGESQANRDLLINPIPAKR